MHSHSTPDGEQAECPADRGRERQRRERPAARSGREKARDGARPDRFKPWRVSAGRSHENRGGTMNHCVRFALMLFFPVILSLFAPGCGGIKAKSGASDPGVIVLEGDLANRYVRTTATEPILAR